MTNPLGIVLCGGKVANLSVPVEIVHSSVSFVVCSQGLMG